MLHLTANQQRVLVALRQADGPLGAYALLERLRTQGFSAPMQVYRALERLTGAGLVHRLATLNAYVPCEHPEGCQHAVHAFAICDQCGHVNEFIDNDLKQSLQRWGRGHAFSLGDSAIELHGQCAHCAAGAGPGVG